jgi:hypothetical protein
MLVPLLLYWGFCQPTYGKQQISVSVVSTSEHCCGCFERSCYDDGTPALGRVALNALAVILRIDNRPVRWDMASNPDED